MIIKTSLTEQPALGAMFEARKHVFVDLLKWDLEIVDERFEIDQFDDPCARYLIIADTDGTHLASARLLQTDRPHLLADVFGALCEDAPPTGPKVREITRFCLSRAQSAASRRTARNRLVSALVRDALDRGIQTYTGVAEIGWLSQILAFGWRCRPLGLPQRWGEAMIGALAIDIDDSTPRLLAANGIWSDDDATDLREAA